MASTAKGEITRDRMIDAAIGLMRGSGLTGAGINEIVKASRAPKGSMYHFFPGGKAQIATEALTLYTQRVLAVLEQALSRATTPDDKVRDLFAVFARRLEDGRFRSSCAAGAVCLDLDDDRELLRRAIAGAFSQWIDLIAANLGFRDRRRARSFAGLVLTSIEGAYIRGRAERSSRPFKEAGLWLAEMARVEATR